MIYFVRVAEFVKIGFSSGVLDRIKAIESHNPQELVILGCIDGLLDDEKKLHREFEEYWHRNEWFRATPKLLKGIAAILKKYGKPLPVSKQKTLVVTKRGKIVRSSPPPREKMKLASLRLPLEQIERLRCLGAEIGIGWQVMFKRIIADRLVREKKNRRRRILARRRRREREKGRLTT